LQLTLNLLLSRSWIDVLVILKDRQELESLIATLENGTEEKFHAEKSLKGLVS
jgi:hypothetical protein